ncbi:MAG: hypothetical protein H7249_13010 [Chitinophagaceae bacterium]|nr:hypothetical protein [Oligoflexus sp.]
MFKRSLLNCSFFALAFTLYSTAFALDFGTVTATRNRSNPKEIALTLNFTSVTPTDNSALGVLTSSVSEVQQAMTNHLDICLPTLPTQTVCGETDVKVLYTLTRKPTPQTGIYVSTTQLANFATNGTIVTTDIANPTIHSYVVTILLDDAVNAFPVGQKVFLRLFPEKISANGNKDKLDIVATLGSGVKDPVSVLGAYPTPKSLIAAWSPKATVAYKDGSTNAPTAVYGILIPNLNNAETLPSIPATTYVADPTATPPSPASCNVVPAGLDTDSPTCSVTCTPADVAITLNTAGIAAAGIASQTTASLTESSLGFTGITVANGPYAIVLQYLPEGTALSCVIGSPSDAATLVQINGGPEPTTGDPSCFIATAAYGSALDPHIDILRWFRDAYLLKTSLGKHLVQTYYRSSPPLAAWIKTHEWARALTRGILWAPVLCLEMFRNHFILTVGLGLFLTLGTLYFVRRRLA